MASSTEHNNTLIKAESNTELKTTITLPHSVSITDVADLQSIQTGLAITEGKNLCSASLGAKVLFATDDWFATADNLLKDTPPEFDEDAYCEQVSMHMHIHVSKCCCLLRTQP
jgi:hypothetical protein